MAALPRASLGPRSGRFSACEMTAIEQIAKNEAATEALFPRDR